MSLRLRLTLTYVALLAVIIGFFGLFLYITMQRSLEAERDRRLEVRAAQVQLTIWPGTVSLRPEDLTLARLDLSPLADLRVPGIYVQVLNPEGAVIGMSENLRGAALPAEPEAVADARAGKRTFSDMVVDGSVAIRILTVPITEGGKVVGVMQVGQSRQSLYETMSGLRNQLLILGSMALLAAGVCGWLVAYRGLRPLRAMSRQAAAIGARRDFSHRLAPARRRDEVGQLSSVINQLLHTVEDTLRRHREFVADTSHELRNPLLAMRTNLDLVDRVDDDAARAECLAEVRGQVERMSRLVSELLALAQVEAGQIVERRPVALSALVRRVVGEAGPRAEGRRLVVERADDVEVLGDEARLGQVVTNLVNNAVRHTPPEGAVNVSLAREDGWARISVADTGEGIPAEHLPRVFDRFYRVDRTRAHADGTGLGLAIVKHLTEAHGGWVRAESQVGRGSRFTVWLPLPGARPPLRAAPVRP
ncbi:MAG: HAMP domain-containing protein [Chloroflexi bacterium]|nr:HAMP domain-containing protein [Chloroflexota bacterium]